MEGLNIKQDNILEKPEEERVAEYAKKVVKISSLKEAEELVRNIIITEKRASLLLESKLASECRIDVENIYRMFKEYKKYSLFKVKDFSNIEQEIEDFIKKNKNSFKEGLNIFFIETSKDNPTAVVAQTDSDINVEDIETYSTPNNDLWERFKKEHEFITPDKIKK